eukprot:jgi/Phyca11/535240/estExt2_fgenesh1_pg.C_PHYCAscaffold_330062
MGLVVVVLEFQVVHDSWEAFEEALKAYGKMTYQLYVIRSTTSVKRRNIKISESSARGDSGSLRKELGMEHDVDMGDHLVERTLIPEQYQWYSKSLKCTHGWKDRHRGTGKRGSGVVRSTSCPAKMCVTLQHRGPSPDDWKVVVTKHVRTHNHQLSRELYLYYTENRRIYDPELLSDDINSSLKAYSDATYQLYRTRTTSSAKGRNKKIAQMKRSEDDDNFAGTDPEADLNSVNMARKIPEAWRWYSKTLTCTHGWKERHRGTGKRSAHGIRSTACPVKICATVQYVNPSSGLEAGLVSIEDSDESCWRVVVTKHIVDHNHNLSRELYQHYCENRRIYDPELLAIDTSNSGIVVTPQAQQPEPQLQTQQEEQQVLAAFTNSSATAQLGQTSEGEAVATLSAVAAPGLASANIMLLNNAMAGAFPPSGANAIPVCRVHRPSIGTDKEPGDSSAHCTCFRLPSGGNYVTIVPSSEPITSSDTGFEVDDDALVYADEVEGVWHPSSTIETEKVTTESGESIWRAPRIIRRYPTWEAFHKYLDAYSAATFQLYRRTDGSSTWSVVVTKHLTEHNHELSETLYQQYCEMNGHLSFYNRMAFFQGGDFVELLSAQGKAPASSWKLQGKISKTFDKGIKGNAFTLDGSSETKMQLPKSASSSLGLAQRFVVLQLLVPFTRSFSVEICFSDFHKVRRRFVAASAFRDTARTMLHVQLPLNAADVPRDQWMNLVFDLQTLSEIHFPDTGYRCMEYICQRDAENLST